MTNKLTNSELAFIKNAGRNQGPLTSERLISLDKVPRHDGKRYSGQLLRRWADRGKNGSKLETIKLHGKTMTSEAAVRRFLDKSCASP